MAEPTNKAKIHPALAEALHADRESLNQRFALRQRARAKIDERLPLLLRFLRRLQPDRSRQLA